MASDPEITVFKGTVVDSSGGLPLNISKCVLGFQNGKIIFREVVENESLIFSNYDLNKDDVHVLSPRQFLMPGLIDTHLHAPQFRFLGTHVDYTLLQWLEACTFPVEAKFSDLSIATDVFNRIVKDTVQNGTTTASYFSSIHLEASLLLSDIIEQQGQRAFVGKVNMDVNSPSYYCETMEESMNNTEIFINKLRAKNNPLVSPIVTPRFAIQCSSQLLQFLGSMAKKYDIPIQSHLCECENECKSVAELFPHCKSYAEVYDIHDLLTNKTVMAHGVHLTEHDCSLLHEKGSGISHCPNSNICLRSGLCDVRNLLNKNIKVGLGTDVAAGYSVSILDAIRQALLTSKTIGMKNPEYQILTYQEAFRMATLGGAEIFQLDNEIGNLEVGKQFDALLIDVDGSTKSLRYFSDDTIQETVEKFLYQGDDRDIQRVYVGGNQIK